MLGSMPDLTNVDEVRRQRRLRGTTIGLALLVVAAVGVSVSTGVQTNRVLRESRDAWHGYEGHARAEVEVLLDLYACAGYLGMIHHFKNLVLRRDLAYAERAIAAADRCDAALRRYDGLGLDPELRPDLEIVRRTLRRYRSHVEAATELIRQGASVDAIDRAVRVDDAAAGAALARLEADWRAEWQAGSRRVDASVDEGLGLVERSLAVLPFYLLVGIVLVWALWSFGRELLLRREAQRRFDDVASAVGDVIWELAPDGTIRYVNEAATALFECPHEALIGRPIESVLPDAETHARLTNRYAAAAQARETVDGLTHDIVTPSGERKTVRASAVPVYGTGGALVGLRGALRDVGAEVRHAVELEILASTDALTGAMNRRAFLACAERSIACLRGSTRSLCVLIVDLDHFKRVNDQHGHAIGDRALQVFVGAAGSALRESDRLGRIGGEEFAALVECDGTASAARVAERICAAVRASPVRDVEPPLHFTASIGVARIDFDDVDPVHAALMRADAALYRAKAEGRDRVVAESETAQS